MSEKEKEKEPMFFDSSSLDLFLLCPRRYYYARECSLSPLIEPKPLTFGKGVHKFVQGIQEGKDAKSAIKDFVLEIKNTPNNDIKVSNSESDDDYTIENGINQLYRYAQFYADDPLIPITTPPPESKPYVEVEFALSLEAGMFWGRMDGIVYDKSDPETLMVFDTKHTMKPINDSFWQRYQLSNQLTNYMWAATTMLGKPVLACIVNAIRMFPLKRGSESSIAEKSFVRSSITRSLETVLRREEELNWQMAYIRKCKEYGKSAFMQNTASCNAYGRPCPYMPLCLSQYDSVTKRIIDNNYRKSTWHPEFDALQEDQGSTVVTLTS